MKTSKRFLSLLLAVTMVMGLMLSGVSATTVASESKVIYESSFEGVTELPANAAIGTLRHEAYWSGGDYEVVTIGGKTGTTSIKLTPSTHTNTNAFKANGGWLDNAKTLSTGRVLIEIDSAKFEVGATYKATAWFKGSKAGTAVNINVQDPNFQTTGLNPNPNFTIGTDWVQQEVEFVVPEGVGAAIRFRFGSSNYTDNAEDALLVDDIKIVKTKDAPKAEPEVDPNEVFSSSFEDDTGVLTGASSKYGTTFFEAYWGGGAHEVITSDAKTGSKSVKLTTTNVENRGYLAGWADVHIGVDKFEVGATYKVSMWVKSSKANVKANILANANPDNFYTNLTSTDWTLIENEFVMLDGVQNNMRFRFGAGAALGEGEYVLVDDIKIVKTKDAPKPEEPEGDPNEIYAEDFEEITSLETVDSDHIPVGTLVNELYWGAGAAEIITTDGKVGGKSVKLTPTYSNVKGDHALGRVAIRIDASKFEVGATYKVSAWFKASAANFRGNINVQASPYTILNNDAAWTDVGTQWVLKEVEFVMPEGVETNMLFRFGSSSYPDENAYILVDGISIVKIKDTPGGEDEDSGDIYAEDFEKLTEIQTTGSIPIGTLVGELYWGAGAYEIISTDSKDGDKSVKLTPTLSGSKNALALGRVAIRIDASKFEVGANYLVSAWFKADKANSKANINVQANPHTILNNDAVWTDVGTEWILKEVQFTMPEGVGDAMLFRFGCSAYPVEESAYMLVDGISIVKVEKTEDDENKDPNLFFESSFEDDGEELTGASGRFGTTFFEQYYGGGAHSVITGDAHTGDKSVKLTTTEVAGRGFVAGWVDVYLNASDFKVGETYKVSAWFKASKDGLEANILAHANPHNYYVALPGTEWTRVEYEFEMTEGFATSNMRFRLGSGRPIGEGEYILVDDIRIERVLKVKEIELNATEEYVEIGKTLDLSCTLIPADIPSDISYTSSNLKVATVDANGKITAVGVGTAIITATAINGDVSDTCIIHVVEKYVALEGISVNKETLNVNPGWTEQLSVTLNPTNATVAAPVWTSSDETVATVDKNGKVTALKVGTATITATVGGFTKTCTVTVADDSSFASTTQNITVDIGHVVDVDLSEVLEGTEYTLISDPAKGKVSLNGSTLTYTAYTWQMAKDGPFQDAQYSDEVKVAVKNGNKAAIITVKVTVDKLSEQFYDSEGNWITDVTMMFTEEELAAIKAEVVSNPNGVRAKLFKNALKAADSFINSTPPAYVPPVEGAGVSYDYNLTNVGDKALNFMMAYLLTKDMEGYEEQNARYLEKTIEWTKATLGYPYWGTLPAGERNSNLPGCHMLYANSMIYYWLKDELQDVTCTDVMGTDGTTSTIVTTSNMPILDALEKRIWFVGKEIYDHNVYTTGYVWNHLMHRSAALMAATIALREDAETATEQQTIINWTGFVFYKGGLSMYWSLPDGSSMEGISYWSYGAEPIIKYSTLIEQNYGVDLFETTGCLEKTAEFFMASYLPADHWIASKYILNIADANGTIAATPSMIMRKIAATYGNANAQWFAECIEDANLVGSDAAHWLSLFVVDPDLEPVAPSQDETMMWFEDIDLIIGRTDWSGNEDVLVMKTGIPCGRNLLEAVRNGSFVGNPDAGHAHPDANHITLYANGEYLLRDDGYYRKFASNHNTLLVNGMGQIGEGGDWLEEKEYINTESIPFIKIAESNSAYDFIVGDATEAYSSKLGLSLFERNVLWLKEEQVLLVVDNVKADAETNFELRWFPESKSVGRQGDVYIVNTSKNVMNFFPLTDDTATSFEDVTVYTATSSTATKDEKTFRQTYKGTEWQNAVAFSWNDAGSEAAYVKYVVGEDGDHVFGVNGKIYTINAYTNEVTVEEGELEVEDDETASDSTISTVILNGVVVEGFDSAVKEMTVDRWWKTATVDVKAYTNAYGATVEIEYNNKTPGTITLVCTSKDGTSKTTYTINVTNTQNILGIEEVTTDRPREGFPIEYVYDSVLTPTNTDPRIWANTGLPTLWFDLGKVVNLQDVIIAFNLSAKRDSYYDLAYSVDGENWITLKEDATVEQTPGTDNLYCDYVKVVESANINARYIQLKLRAHSQATKDDPGAYCSIQEITFIGSEYTGVNITGGTIADAKDFYKAGDEITVTAEVPEGKKFVRWEVEGVEVEDLTAATITFTLGADDVKLVAIFEDVIPGGGDDDNTGDDNTGDDNTGDDNTGSGEDDGPSDTGDNVMLMSALLLAVMALAACTVLTVGKKYRR